MFVGKNSTEKHDVIHEISDSAATIDFDKLQRTAPRNGKSSIAGELGDILKHSDLFKNYPELRSIKVRVRHRPGDGDLIPGAWDERKHEIDITLRDSIKGKSNAEHLQQRVTGTLLHEVQHVIQQIESWPRGSGDLMWKEAAWHQYSNSNEFLSKSADPGFNQVVSSYRGIQTGKPTRVDGPLKHNELATERTKLANTIHTIAYGLYLRDPGEVQARSVEAKYLGRTHEIAPESGSVRDLPGAPSGRLSISERISNVRLNAARMSVKFRSMFNQETLTVGSALGNAPRLEKKLSDNVISQSQQTTAYVQSASEKMVDIPAKISGNKQHAVPIHAVAFDKLPPDEAVKQFPELEGAYQVLAQAKHVAERLPNEVARKEFLDASRQRISAELHAGREVAAVALEQGRGR